MRPHPSDASSDSDGRTRCRYVGIVTQDNLNGLTVQQLISLHRATLQELVRRGVVRTMNAPQGDFAERLVAKAFDGELAPNSEKSWDVRTGSGVLLQVKSRVVHDGDPASARATSPFRSWGFDAAVIVFLANDDLSVVQATELPVEAVRGASRWVDHVNGWVLTPSQAVMASGRDVTELLRAAAASL